MAIDVKALNARTLSQEEAESVKGRSDAAVAITWLADQLRDLPVGGGIEIGPFDRSNDAKNFNSYFTSKAVEQLGWGKNGHNKEGASETKTTSPRTRAHVREREGKNYLWIVRLRE